jgi:hypothetical protein
MSLTTFHKVNSHLEITANCSVSQLCLRWISALIHLNYHHNEIVLPKKKERHWGTKGSISFYPIKVLNYEVHKSKKMVVIASNHIVLGWLYHAAINYQYLSTLLLIIFCYFKFPTDSLSLILSLGMYKIFIFTTYSKR